MRGTCENPEHEGDRLVDRRDLVERRIEWRDLTTQGRFATRIVRRDCKPCVRIELLANTPETEALL
ncbi:MAG TPA: hypothetical protein VFT76_00140 [Actinomycetota bacterium]|nr:hypothetical protein [Actinomycetota bacterium]